MLLSCSFRLMCCERVCFWVSAAIALLALAFSNLKSGMSLKEQGSRKLAELNTREHGGCRDCGAKRSCVLI